jgi:cation-transporting ATPase E
VLTTIAVLCGLLLIPFVEPPSPAWTGGDELSGDKRPGAVAAAMLALFAAILWIPGLRSFFELTPLAPIDIAIVGAVVVAWWFGLRAIWRSRLLQRLLGLGDEAG